MPVSLKQAGSRQGVVQALGGISLAENKRWNRSHMC
jgi:hypothetical protein